MLAALKVDVLLTGSAALVFMQGAQGAAKASDFLQ